MAVRRTVVDPWDPDYRDRHSAPGDIIGVCETEHVAGDRFKQDRFSDGQAVGEGTQRIAQRRRRLRRRARRDRLVEIDGVDERHGRRQPAASSSSVSPERRRELSGRQRRRQPSSRRSAGRWRLRRQRADRKPRTPRSVSYQPGELGCRRAPVGAGSVSATPSRVSKSARNSARVSRIEVPPIRVPPFSPHACPRGASTMTTQIPCPASRPPGPEMRNMWLLVGCTSTSSPAGRTNANGRRNPRQNDGAGDGAVTDVGEDVGAGTGTGRGGVGWRPMPARKARPTSRVRSSDGGNANDEADATTRSHGERIAQQRPSMRCAGRRCRARPIVWA